MHYLHERNVGLLVQHFILNRYIPIFVVLLCVCTGVVYQDQKHFESLQCRADLNFKFYFGSNRTISTVATRWKHI